MDRTNLLALLHDELPGGLTADDRLAAESASSESLTECLNRIRIAKAIAANATSIRKVVGSGAYGRTLLYQIRRRWNADPSLRSLMPYARREPSTPPRRSDPRLTAAYAAAAKAEAADPSSSVGAVAWKLAKRTDIGFTTLRSMAWRARQRRLGKLIPQGDPQWRAKRRPRKASQGCTSRAR